MELYIDIDVLGIQEMHFLGEETERSEVWGRIKRMGMSESYKGQKKEGVVILLSERIDEGILESRIVNSRFFLRWHASSIQVELQLSINHETSAKSAKGNCRSKETNKKWT